MSAETHMRREILEIPATVEGLLVNAAPAIEGAAAALRSHDPAFMITVARGSSDHAAKYLKYAAELMAGIPVASVGPSVASIYGRKLKLANSACLSISQSGKSPDIVRMTDMANRQGSLSLALTNHAESDLARTSAHVLELLAGQERSVAATKTFVTSVVCAVWILAEWQRDTDLLAALHGLPDALEKATRMDWMPFGEAIGDRTSLYCLGRGPSLAISNEAALKFKETCQLHAESYSSAEVLHGPVSIIGPGFPVLALTSAGREENTISDVAADIAGKGAAVFVTSAEAQGATSLPAARTGHPLLDPITLIVSFYAMVEQLARTRGINPDEPRHLKKVTETV